ncbi:MAG: CBS domain-containing protein [Xanthomonadales bacterium]|nr:CBS domain-containing protein [Xanthomonadales bacterium]
MFSLDMIMTTDLVTVHPTDSFGKARELMRSHRIRHLPVVDEAGRLVGLLTQTDVFAATDSFLRDKEDRMPVRVFPVEDVMITEVATVEASASLRQAALFIEKNRIGCLPVTREGKLVGIITDSDFVGVAINLLEQLEEAEADTPESGDLEDESL